MPRATIAVAANFAEPMAALAPLCEDAFGRELELAAGATGKLYAQITHGAPFDVLLAADDERPRRLAAEGLADPTSLFTYALWRLVLWSPGASRTGPRPCAPATSAFLRSPIRRLPPTARATLEKLGLWEAFAKKSPGREHRPDLRHGRKRQCRTWLRCPLLPRPARGLRPEPALSGAHRQASLMLRRDSGHYPPVFLSSPT